MSTFWQKPDFKCHHCKEPFYDDGDMDFFCSPCEEWNGWQDSSLGWFTRFCSWIGRKYW